MLQYLFFFLVHFFFLVGCHPIMRESNGIGNTKIKYGSNSAFVLYLSFFYKKESH